MWFGAARSGQTILVALVLMVASFYAASLFGNKQPIYVSQASSQSAHSKFANKIELTYQRFRLVIPEIGMNVCPLKFNEYISIVTMSLTCTSCCQILRWEIDAKLSPGRKEEWSNMLDEQSRWVLAIGLGSSMMKPLGKHDGMVKGTRFFECPLLHGGMVRPDKVKVGDYPERDPFEEDEI